MVYFESIILLIEQYENCHLFELNEYYNIINHQAFSIRDGIVNFDSEIEMCKDDIIQIFDAKILDDQVYVLSQLGLTKFDIYDETTE